MASISRELAIQWMKVWRQQNLLEVQRSSTHRRYILRTFHRRTVRRFRQALPALQGRIIEEASVETVPTGQKRTPYRQRWTIAGEIPAQPQTDPLGS